MKIKGVHVLMIITTLLWGGAFIAGKFSTPHIPTFTLTFLRFLFASVILGVFFKIKNRNEKNIWKFKKRYIPFFV